MPVDWGRTMQAVIGFVVFVGWVVAMLNSLQKLKSALSLQLNVMRRAVDGVEHERLDQEIAKHISDLKFMEAMVMAVSLFLLLRLALGLFGMDLYEIYWWFALGLTLALLNMTSTASTRTEFILARLSTS